MSAQEKPQSKSQNLLDLVSKEEMEKIEAHKAEVNGGFPVDDHWMIIAEFTRIYGWQSYLDFKDDKIQTDEMMTLIAANRKLEYLDQYRASLAAFIGAGSAQTKKPSSIFKKLTNPFIKKAKADE